MSVTSITAEAAEACRPTQAMMMSSVAAFGANPAGGPLAVSVRRDDPGAFQRRNQLH